MATRSTISVQQNDGTIKTIYCHWDGYPSGVGESLFNHFKTIELAEQLLELGDCSVIACCNKIAPESGQPHSYEHPVDGVVVAYYRDRGESLTKASLSKTFSDAQKEEYNYLFKGGKWFVDGGKDSKLVPLTVKNTKR